MIQNSASSTALGTLYMRAVHQLLDARPLILDDAPAVKLLGAELTRKISSTKKHHRTLEARALRSHVVVRSRFAEDRLAAAAGRGIRQYIILGAGFDTFAFRQPVWAKDLKVFEVDNPSTQEKKNSMLAAAGMVPPSNLFFAGIDFEKESLHDGLKRSGVSFKEPAFFSWLGVTMYLREEAIDSVLRTIAQFPAGSEVVFTFSQPPDSLGRREKSYHSLLAGIVRKAGEPFISYFTAGAIQAKLHSTGFKTIFFLSAREAEDLYFRKRPRDLFLTQRALIADAIV
jgi:methyltransferase (TIGR00027 family)